MAKAKGGEGKGASHDVGEMIQKSEAGRARKRKAALLSERGRTQQAENGELFRRLNAGRNNDINDLLAGSVGDFAFPGDDKPSAHFRVWMSKPRDPHKLPVAVVAFESAQRGHELIGVEWKTNIFLPTFRIMQSGPNYKSNFTGIDGQTQEMLCHFLYKEATRRREADAKAASEKLMAERREAEARRLAEDEARKESIRKDRAEREAKKKQEAIKAVMPFVQEGPEAMKKLKNLDYGYFKLVTGTIVEVRNLDGERVVKILFSEDELLNDSNVHMLSWLVRSVEMIPAEKLKMTPDMKKYKALALLHKMLRESFSMKSETATETNPVRVPAIKPPKAPAPSGKKAIQKRRRLRGMRRVPAVTAAQALSDKFRVREGAKMDQIAT